MLNVLQSTKQNLYAELQTHTLTEKKTEVKTPSRSIRTLRRATRGLYTRIRPKTLDLVIIVYATLAKRPIYMLNFSQKIQNFLKKHTIFLIKHIIFTEIIYIPNYIYAEFFAKFSKFLGLYICRIIYMPNIHCNAIGA